MKFQTILATGALALALNACGSAADDSKPRKGTYKPEIELTKLNFTGQEIPESMMGTLREQMQTQFKNNGGTEQCLDGSDDKKWDKMSKGMTQGIGGECETVTDNNTDDTMDLVMKCTGTQMGDVTITTKGKAESESLDFTFEFDMENIPQLGSGEMDLKMTAVRTGDC